jgi:hypothetical protein
MKDYLGCVPVQRGVKAVALISTCLLVALPAKPVGAAELKAEYRFNNNLTSSVPGAPALVPVDPLGQNAFNSDTVNGSAQTVYTWGGNATPVTDQAGFTLDTTGLVATNSYSVQMIFKLTQREAAWRRLVDVENRQSDDGFYVNPSDHLAIYPIISSVTPFTNNVYEDVLLTVDGGVVTAYLNGEQQFSGTSALMNINLNNQGNTLGFFIDNVAAGGQGEFSNGSIALLRLYGGVVSPSPSLFILPTTTNSVVVYWPSPSTGWKLQYNTNLATTNWTAYTDPISDNGITRSVVVTPPSGCKFFRLSNP